MSDLRYRILDVALEELLGGQSPPDLTDRILQVRKLPSSTDDSSPVSSTAESRDVPVPTVEELHGVPITQDSSNRRRARRDWKLPVGVALSVAVCLLVLVSVIG